MYYIDANNFYHDELDNREVKVSIRCLAYNHGNYIRDCLEGFVRQKTNFRFEAIVHDDCSSDNTSAIIREYAEKYPSIIKPIFEEENQWGKGVLGPLMDKHLRGKYIAMCEGDDYWTDDNKLQRQVDFLDNNLSYSMIAENATILNSITDSTYPFSTEPSRDISSMEEVITKRKFPTAGVLLRAKYVHEIYNENNSVHDTFVWCWMLERGPIRYEDIISSVYRRALSGFCEGTEHYAFGKVCEEWDLKLMNQFNINKKFIYITIAKIYWYTYERALENKKYGSASKSLFKMFSYCLKYPFAPKQK